MLRQGWPAIEIPASKPSLTRRRETEEVRLTAQIRRDSPVTTWKRWLEDAKSCSGAT